jgi:hypothetical protein
MIRQNVYRALSVIVFQISMNEHTDKWWHSHAMKYYIAVKPQNTVKCYKHEGI